MNPLLKLITIICFSPLVSFSQNWQWEKSEGGSGNDNGYSICTDGSGNCYVAGNSAGQGFISKYNSSGTSIWNMGAINPSNYGVAICYYNGYLYYASDSFANAFVSKYDLNGNFIWKANCGSGVTYGITSDNFGHIYVTGADVFLVKVDTSGNILWIQNNQSTKSSSVCTDLSGNVYTTGFFFGPTSFGTYTLNSLGFRDIFIAKYDSSGNCIWAKRAGGNHNGPYSDDIGYGIVADTLGHLYATGSFVDTADFNSIILTSPTPGSNDVFLAKYDTSGNIIWVQQANGTSDQEGRCIAIDYQGNILIGGSYVPPLYFNSYQLNGSGNYDAFVAKYDPSGNFISAISAGGATWNEYVYGICSNNSGNIFVSGSFSDVAYFDADSLVSQGNYDIFVGEIDFTTGITEQTQNFSLRIFPNPASSNIQFQTTSTNEIEIIITDQLGREVMRQKNNGENQITISITDLSNGMYFYQFIEKGERKASGKFIVQH